MVTYAKTTLVTVLVVAAVYFFDLELNINEDSTPTEKTVFMVSVLMGISGLTNLLEASSEKFSPLETINRYVRGYGEIILASVMQG